MAGNKYKHTKTGPRNLLMDRDFFNRLREKTGLKLDDKILREIILTSNEAITDVVANSDDVFKLPENLGYVGVTKWKNSNARPVDWKNSRRLKKFVPILNLHSFGYIYHIKWFKPSSETFGIKRTYKLEPTRILKRTVAKNVKGGKNYHEWSYTDFWNINRIYKKLDSQN